MSSSAELLASYRDPDTVTRSALLDARFGRAVHPPHRPVSRATYVKHGCRCNGCRTANRRYGRVYRGLPPEPPLHPIVAKLRTEERGNRQDVARARALAALARRHADEYRQLYDEQRHLVALERGPLPGDDC